jgi:hypothetical protein
VFCFLLFFCFAVVSCSFDVSCFSPCIVPRLVLLLLTMMCHLSPCMVAVCFGSLPSPCIVVIYCGPLLCVLVTCCGPSSCVVAICCAIVATLHYHYLLWFLALCCCSLLWSFTLHCCCLLCPLPYITIVCCDSFFSHCFVTPHLFQIFTPPFFVLLLLVVVCHSSPCFVAICLLK